MDHYRKPVDGFGQANERFRAFLIESSHPGGDGERAHLKDPSRLGE